MKRSAGSLFFLFSFFLVTNLTYAQNYDYLIIAPDILCHDAAWVDELTELQTSRGFHSLIKSVQENTTALQIKEIIKSFYNNNPLKYVMMMGGTRNLPLSNGIPDTTIPYKHTEHGIINYKVDYANGSYLPFLTIYSKNPWHQSGWVHIATDDPYVSELKSHGPVYIGRVPVSSITEADNYVGKLGAYYKSLSKNYKTFSREILLNLDVTYPKNGCTGELVKYIIKDLKENHIPDTSLIVELNVSEHTAECDPFLYCLEREQLFEYWLNQGASIVTQLATIGGPYNFGGWYWNNSSFNFTNINTVMPFLIAPNCHQGEINNPDFESTVRMLLVHGSGGIIGAIAPTEGSEQHANGYVLNRFHDLIYEDETITYSKVFRIIKEELWEKNSFSWLEFFNNGLTFFGDPSLVRSEIMSQRSAENNGGEEIESLPEKYSLLGNFPNPFNPGTTIRYDLPYQSAVLLSIYDITGAEVKNISIGSQSAGSQNIIWDGRNENGSLVPGGVYLYRLHLNSIENSESFIITGKLMMVK